MKSPLHKLQTDFSAAIRFKDPSATENLPINETNGVSKETRLEVYGYSYWIRLEKSLRDDFFYTFEKLGDQVTPTIQQFIKETQPGHHILGDVSLAFCDFIIKTKPEYRKEAALDRAVLISEFTPWIYELEKIESTLLKPQQLSELSPDEIRTLWNTTLQFVEKQIVVQKMDSTEILDPEPQVLSLLEQHKEIQTFTQLLEKIAELNFSDSAASTAIAFLTANDILYFAKN